MTIVPITEKNLMAAAAVHAAAWRASHKTICTSAFVAEHTTQLQARYLQQEAERGKKLWLLLDPEPAGLVSVGNDVIENLYVLPEKQGRGYGTALLRFAMSKCRRPTLWVLNSNQRAYQWYERKGFVPTGAEKPLSGALYECEMIYQEASPCALRHPGF